MSDRYPPVPQIIGARPTFKYSAPWHECRIIHAHTCMGTRLLVVGDPDNGCYEWVILTDGRLDSHSDAGYGISEVALRDGLIEAFKDCFGPPVSPAANPAHKEALEKHHEALTQSLANPAHSLEGWSAIAATPEPTSPASEPSRSHAIPTPKAEALFSHRLADCPNLPDQPVADTAHAHTAGGPATMEPPVQGAETPATGPAQDAGTTRQQLAQLLAQAGYQTAAGNTAIPGCESAPSVSRDPHAAARSSSSSADPTDSCGDINCDDQCSASPAAKADHPPALIQLIDVSPTLNDARIATANATTTALRAAARFLRTDMHSLPGVIMHRVRERLAKAAA